jgi:hypothetical protein
VIYNYITSVFEAAAKYSFLLSVTNILNMDRRERIELGRSGQVVES